MRIPRPLTRRRSLVFFASSSTLCAACASSDLASTPSDAGATRETSAPVRDAPASDAPKSCSPFGNPVCPKGETCCLRGLEGTCREVNACTTTTQFECVALSCAAGEVCCGTFEVASDGGAIATTFCKESCSLPAHPVCVTSADCAPPGICTILPEGANSAVLAAAVESYSVCKPPDGGATP